MRAKLSQGQINIMKNWMLHKQAQLAALMSIHMTMRRAFGEASFINDEIMDCHDAMDYYGSCIKTGYTD